MSASLFGHAGGGHDQNGRQAFLWIVAVFVLIWVGNAIVFQLEMAEEHRQKAKEAAKHEPAKEEKAKHEPEGHTAGEAFYRSLQLFHFHDSHWGERPNWMGLSARFCAGAYALGIPLVLLAWLFRGGVRRWCHHFFAEDFVVIVGTGNEVRRLATDLVQNDRIERPGGFQQVKRWFLQPVVTVSEHEEHHPLPGVIHFEGDLSSTTFWQDVLRAGRARAILLMSDDDATNIRWSHTLERALKKRKKAPLPCHLRLSSLHLKKGLLSLLPQNETNAVIERRYFNEHELAARLLARRYPLPSTLVEEEALPEHYVIIGFGELGQNVALKLVKMGQQVVRKERDGEVVFEMCRPRVTVIERQGERATEAFLRSHPGFKKTCEFRVLEMDCQSHRFLELEFLDRSDPRECCSLIYCLRDEPLVVTTILMMLDVCESPERDIDGIYLRATLEDGPAELLRRRMPTLAKNVPIVTFAPEKEIWSEDVIMNLSLDLMAEQIHEAYREVAMSGHEPANPAPAMNQSWLALSAEEKDGNREPADHMWAKVRTVGYELEAAPIAGRKGEGPVEVDAALLAEIEARMEDLARSEHYRWMVWRLIHGWRQGSPRDNAARIHPDLVEYEKLTEHAREKDRAIVRIIPTLIRLGRLRARKME